MSEEDDAWALGWVVDYPKLKGCFAARVTIDGITHRVLDEGSGWRTLCRSHRLVNFRGGLAIVGFPLRCFDFSPANVDCLCCIPAGG